MTSLQYMFCLVDRAICSSLVAPAWTSVAMVSGLASN